VEVIGGQAGTSSLRRNYLGFTRGIRGQELAAQAFQQGTWFGADFRLMRSATGLRRNGRELVVTLSDGAEVVGRAVIIATGASYPRLGVPELEMLNGAGVFIIQRRDDRGPGHGRSTRLCGGRRNLRGAGGYAPFQVGVAGHPARARWLR
jgi:thioredoxin reductase (NADPH)